MIASRKECTSRGLHVSILACIDREGTLDAGLSKDEYADAVLIH
jgi:hypothetical protein